MTSAEFLSRLRERDVRLWVDEGRLKCDAPPGAIDHELRAQLADRKQELLTLLAEAQRAAGAPRSLVPLKTTGEYPPLFARPGHNGDVFCYRALAEYLDSRRPLYGVEPWGLDGSPAAETVEEMAEYEVAQIRGLQPEGPYYIAGYCAGGSIAFESAIQLARAGEHVARVLLFGSPFPAAYRDGRLLTELRSLDYRARRHAATLTSGSVTDGLAYVRSRARARASQVVQRNDPALANRRRVEEATLAAIKRYEPGFYAGRVDLFLPNEVWRRSGDRADEWQRVAARVVEHVGPDESDGDSMLREPHARALATLLNRSLQDEERHYAAG
jgi:thioesterase domain-containing protein